MRRLLLLVSAIVLVDTMFYAAITPLLPHYAEELDLSKTEAGVLTGAYPAGTLLGALPGGWLAARWGVRPTVLLGLALMSASSLVFGLAGSVPLLDAARFVQGLGGAASWAAALSWLVRAAPRERRGEMIGLAFGAAIGGALLGPVLGAAATAAGPEPVFAGVAAAGAALAAWAARETPPPPYEGPGARGLGTALRRTGVRAGMAVVVLIGLFYGVAEVLVPLRMDRLGAGAALIGAAFLVAAAIQALASPATGRLADRRGPLLPIRTGLAAATALAVLLPLPQTPLLLAVLVVVAGPTVGMLWVPGMALISGGAETAGLDQGYAFALVNLAWAGAQTIGASAGGALAEAAGDAVAYGAVAAACGAALVVVLRHTRARLPASA